MNRIAALAASLFAATSSAPALAHEEEARQDQVSGFTMAVIVDGAHGAKFHIGNYEKAIDRITRSGSRAPGNFADQVNLCVAYTKRNDIENANAACEAAITSVRKQDGRMSRIRDDRNQELRACRANLALALPSRGVLTAATGDAKRAQQDFLVALELRTRNSWIFENNPNRVGQETAA